MTFYGISVVNPGADWLGPSRSNALQASTMPSVPEPDALPSEAEVCDAARSPLFAASQSVQKKGPADARGAPSLGKSSPAMILGTTPITTAVRRDFGNAITSSGKSPTVMFLHQFHYLTARNL
jgi:hypothetical protein